MCKCGQVFPSPVPEFSEAYNSMYWPPASASQPAALNWWADLSPAIKALVGGGIVLLVAVFAVEGSVHQYQTMHARYSPGRPAMVASAAPAPARQLAEAVRTQRLYCFPWAVESPSLGSAPSAPAD